MHSTFRTRTFRATAAGLAVGIIAAGLGLTAPAAAAEKTVTDPGTGARFTVSSSEITAGERINISGTGFVPVEGSTGEPIVAVRPYDFDLGPEWQIGGVDAFDAAAQGNPTAAGEAKHWFITDHTDDGSFEGWIQAPANLTAAGGAGTGDHWLRVLTGAFFTSTGTRLTAPITFRVPLTFVDKVRLGLTAGPPTGQVFQAGTHFRPGASVTVKARAFTPNTGVAVTLDGAPLTGADLTTGPDGVLPASARVTIPTGTPAGTHTLRFATGSNTHDVAITVTPPVEVEVVTPTVKAGGLLAFNLRNFVGVQGTGQKIAVVVNEQVLGCVQADAVGDGSGVVQIPAGLADGTRSVLFNVGLSCLAPPAGVLNDLPNSTSGQPIVISSTAPHVTVPAAAVAGEPVPVAGAGFAANTAVVVTADGSSVPSTLVTDGSGEFSGRVTFTGAGDRRLIFTAGSTVAAAHTVVTAPVASRVSVALSKQTISYGAPRTATVKVTAGSSTAAGQVTLKIGSAARVNATLNASGQATIALPRDSTVGTHVVAASYAGAGGVAASTGSSVLKVVKASATAKIKLSATKVKKSKRVVATLRVAIVGSSIPATGKVSVYDGKKKISSFTLTAARKGVRTVTLPKFKKVGKHNIRFVFAGNANVAAKTSSTTKVTVR